MVSRTRIAAWTLAAFAAWLPSLGMAQRSGETVPFCTLTASPEAVTPGVGTQLLAVCRSAATSYRWTNTGFAPAASGGTLFPSATTTYTVAGTNDLGTGPVASVTVTVAANVTDSVPDAFGFASVTGVALSSLVTSSIVTPTGFNSPAPVSVSNGLYGIGCSNFTAAAGTLSPGQSICVRHNAAGIAGGVNTSSLTVGGVTASFTSTAAGSAPVVPQAGNFQDLWWVGTIENGWGMTITQHGDKLFAAVFAYDRNGKPVWTVMPAGQWNAARDVYSGPLYTPLGTPYFAYNGALLDVGAPIGTLTLRFTSATTLTAEYQIFAESMVKTMTRQLFANGAPLNNRTDLWWGGVSQNGWGVAMTQQGAKIFAVWYTYDENGVPTWFVLPDGIFDAAGTTYSGPLYRTRGPRWFGIPYDNRFFIATAVGSLSFAFTGESAVMTYTVDGLTQTKPIVRQAF